MVEPPDIKWPWSFNNIVNAGGPMGFVNAYARQCAKRARAEAAAHCALIISGARSEDDDLLTRMWAAMWLRDLRRAGARRGGAAPDSSTIERKRALTRERVRRHRARKQAASAPDKLETLGQVRRLRSIIDLVGRSADSGPLWPPWPPARPAPAPAS